MKWEPVNKSWAEYSRQSYEERMKLVGFLIKLKSEEEPLLIGDVNFNGGFCDDCSIEPNDIVLEQLDLRELIKANTP